jgi:hypothetical protein
MKTIFQVVLSGVCCLAIATGVVNWVLRPEQVADSRRVATAKKEKLRESEERISMPAHHHTGGLPTFHDPNAPADSPDLVFSDPRAFDGGVFNLTAAYGDQILDDTSLAEYRRVIAARAGRAKARLAEQHGRLRLDPSPTLDQALEATKLYRELAFVALYEGDHEAAGSGCVNR